MKQTSENRFCPGEVGQSVTVKIPDVDGPVVILETLLE